VVLGVTLLSKELGKRTIYNILSKPVARGQFLIGKFLGLLATLSIMMGLLAAALLAALWFAEGGFDWPMLAAVAAMMLELSILLAVALFFSSIVVTPSLAGFFTVATFIAGRSAGLLSYFTGDDQPPGLRQTMHLLYVILPHLDRLYIADRLGSRSPLPPAHSLQATLYAAAYSGVLLLLSLAIFRRREFF
jgi:Cu-processing system permease protein